MGFDFKQAGLSEVEKQWLCTFLPDDYLSDRGELFCRVVEDVSKELHKSKKGCLAKVQRIFNAAQELSPVEKRQVQEIWFEPACQTIEGLCLAVKGCALKKRDQKLVPKGTTLTSGIQQADAKLKQGDVQGAKNIFSLLARNILIKGDRIAPFENFELPESTTSRLQNWASALVLLNSDYRRK